MSSPTWRPRTVALSLLFVPHFSDTRPGEIWPLLVPGWSLNFEMFFYALFAASLPLRRHATLALVLVCVGLAGAGAVLGPFDTAVARTYTSPLLLEFAAGALLAQAWRRGWARPSAVLAAVCLLGGLALLAQPGTLGSVTRQGGAVLVVAACLCPRWQHRVGWLQTLGDASYAIYLTHVFSLAALGLALRHLLPDPRPAGPALAWLAMATGLLLSAGMGVVVHRRLERPLTQGLRRPGRPGSLQWRP